MRPFALESLPNSGIGCRHCDNILFRSGESCLGHRAEQDSLRQFDPVEKSENLFFTLHPEVS
jgi:hypothetical protein